MKPRWILVALIAVGCKTSDRGSTDAAPAAEAAPAAAVATTATPAPGIDKKLAAACDAGDAKACLAAALTYQPPKPYREDLPYAIRACDDGLGDGCFAAAAMVRWDQTLALLRRGCALGHLGSCGEVGILLVQNKDTVAEGLVLYEKACRGDALGLGRDADDHGVFCADLADLYDGTDKYVHGNDAKATELKALACQQGQKDGCPCTDATAEKDCGDSEDYEISCERGKCVFESLGD